MPATLPRRPRALALAVRVPGVRRTAWWAFVALTLAVLALFARPAVAQTGPFAAAADELHAPEHPQLQPPAAHAALPVELDPARDLTPRATLRSPERPRRAAGRAGVSARRDAGGDAFTLARPTLEPRPRAAGAVPHEAAAVEAPPLRGARVCGVRGPPASSLVLG